MGARAAEETTRNWHLDDFDPRWPAFAADPYPFYRRLREEDPVHYIPSTDYWWLTRHADVNRALGDRRFVKEAPSSVQQPLPAGFEKLEKFPESMLFRDPPDHTRLRNLVNVAFTPKAVERLRPRIAMIATELLDSAATGDRIDVVRDLAFPLPAIVIAEMLGVPKEERDQFKGWSERIIRGMDVTQGPEAQLEGLKANLAMTEYFEVLVAERRGKARDDLLSRLFVAEEAGDRLSPGEVVTMCVLLLVAGHETTTNFIGTGTLTLLRHPDALGRLRRHPEITTTAVEELLRYEAPVQRIARFTREDVEIGGKTIPKDSRVATVFGAANRDPSAFVEPDRLDLTREPNPHIAFGRGIHYCLGAPLARIEASIAFDRLFMRFPDLALDREPVWKPDTFIRGLRSLRVAV